MQLSEGIHHSVGGQIAQQTNRIVVVEDIWVATTKSRHWS